MTQKQFTLEEISASWLGHGKQIPIGESMAWLIKEVERLHNQLVNAREDEAGAQKSREQLIADKDFLYAENRRLKAERDAEITKAERDAAYVRGLTRAIEVIDGLPDGIDCTNAISSEIDKLKTGK